MRGSYFLFILCFGFSNSPAAKKEEHSARIGDLLVTVESVGSSETVPKVIGGRPAWPLANHHFIVVHVEAENLGKRAACANLAARLKTSYSLEYSHVILLEAEPLTVSELLPGEKTEGSYVFEVKDGVTPRELVIEPKGKQGCGGDRSSLFYGRVRISLEGFEIGVKQ